jgi:uncharacterized protein YbjQ (UPF0145 family)
MLVVTPNVPGRETGEVLGMVSGEAILGGRSGGNMLMVSANGTAVRLR